MDINDEGEKQLKNEQSKRRVPVHPFIQELGFLQYVTSIAPEPTERIFPQLRPGGPDKKFGYFFTKWWTQYRKDVGVYQKKLDYHSFRGGVTTKLSAANISLDVRNELLGHEGQSIDQQNYLKGLPLRMLADAIACIEWPEVKISPTDAPQELKGSPPPTETSEPSIIA
jgi:integrase